MKQRNDAYHEVESRQAGKLLLKREMKYGYWFVYAVVSLMILYSLGGEGVDFTSEMFLSQPTAHSFENKEFDYLVYFISGLVLLFIAYGLVVPMSYVQKQKQIEIRRSKGQKIGSFDMYVLSMWKYLDLIFYKAMYPVGLALLAGVNEQDRGRLFFRWGWLSHLEKQFFKQEYKKTDEYERVSKLVLLARYQDFFSEQKGDKALASNDYAFTRWLFKSRSEMIDLLRIAEGFIEAKTPVKKYDKLLSTQEYNERLAEFGSLDAFRTYNGKDEVVFSSDLIKDIIDDEVRKFKTFIETYAFSSRMLFSRRFKKYESAIVNDVNIHRYLFPKTKKQEEIQAIMSDKQKRHRYLVFVLVCYFRFVMFKLIISQYVNFPAGTIVVKLRDYTMRMIIEVFDDNSLINIVKNKNDGGTTTFESDNLANLFLSSLHHYRISSDNPYDERIFKIFNHRDSAELDEGQGYTESDAMGAEVSGFIKNDWIEDIAGMMSSQAT